MPWRCSLDESDDSTLYSSPPRSMLSQKSTRRSFITSVSPLVAGIPSIALHYIARCVWVDSPFCGCWRFARLWLWIWKNVENREIYYLHGAGVFSSLLPVVSATPSCHAAPSRMRLGCYEATTPSPTHPNTMKRAMNKSSSTACQNISFVKIINSADSDRSCCIRPLLALSNMDTLWDKFDLPFSPFPQWISQRWRDIPDFDHHSNQSLPQFLPITRWSKRCVLLVEFNLNHGLMKTSPNWIYRCRSFWPRGC